jgi:hypothetical protein
MIAAGRYEVPLRLFFTVYASLALIGVLVALWKGRK